MGLVLDSSILIATERGAQPVSGLLTALERGHGETEIVISSITVVELEHGVHRADTAERARKRREYLNTGYRNLLPTEKHEGGQARVATPTAA